MIKKKIRFMNKTVIFKYLRVERFDRDKQIYIDDDKIFKEKYQPTLRIYNSYFSFKYFMLGKFYSAGT